MQKTMILMVAIGCGALLVGCGDKPTPQGTSKTNKGKATDAPSVMVPPSAEMKAIKAHLVDGKYVALVLHSGEDVSGFTNALTPLADTLKSVATVVAKSDDASLTPFLTALKLDAATTPTPLTIVIAPNVLVTGVFMKPPTEEALKAALLPEQPLAIRKALSLGKNVVVTMQGAKTAGNDLMKKAVADFLKDPKRHAYVACALDLDKAENASFLKELKIDPSKETSAIVLGMAPPLSIVNKPVRKPAKSIDVAMAVDPACGSDCGPSG